MKKEEEGGGRRRNKEGKGRRRKKGEFMFNTYKESIQCTRCTEINTVYELYLSIVYYV